MIPVVRLFRHCIASRRLMSSRTIEDDIQVTFIGSKKTIVKAKPGKSLYDVVMDNNMDLDGFGSCGACLCCTTCHLILNNEDYNKLTPPTEEELNMLDLADGLCDTSRLGCQVILPRGIKALEVQIPPERHEWP